VAGYFTGAAGLLVLDNCEHVCAACAAFVDRLLSRTRGVVVLATSRTPLGIPGEQLFAVPPLSVPAPARASLARASPAEPSPDALRAYDAVTLLADRVAALRPGFTVTAQNGPAVARLCAQLDGLPLAIELAASRLRSLSPEQLADRLASRFAVLTQGSPVARPRQQTLRAVFDWSYSLCSAAERLLWQRLSVFAGGFDLDAAEGVCAGDGLPGPAILDVLDRLVAQSIVLAEPHGRQMRFRLLETIRQYGQERLAESGAGDALRRRHRDYYAGLAGRLAGERCSPRQAAGLAWLRDEHGNMRAALEAALADPAGPRTALLFLTHLRNHWYADGFLADGRDWLDQALARPAGGAAARAARVNALWVAAWVALLQGDEPAAVARLDECDALAAQLGDRRAAGFARSLRGTRELFAGRIAAAIALFEEALGIFADLGETEGQLWAMFQLSISWAHAGDTARAQAAGQDAVRISEAHGERLCRSYALWVLGFDRWRHGGADPARLARAALAIQREFHDPVGVALITELLAWIAASRGEAGEAARLLATADSVWALIGTTITAFGPPLGTYRADCVALVRSALGARGLAAADRRGRQRWRRPSRPCSTSPPRPGPRAVRRAGRSPRGSGRSPGWSPRG
jgi:predicted ATPase